MFIVLSKTNTLRTDGGAFGQDVLQPAIQNSRDDQAHRQRDHRDAKIQFTSGCNLMDCFFLNTAEIPQELRDYTPRAQIAFSALNGEGVQELKAALDAVIG